jgi:hypothetical protein
MNKRFTSSSHHDPSITQRVRTALYDSGNEDLVHEIVIDGLRDVEQMTRAGLSDHDKRLLMLEQAQRERWTESGVWKVVKAKLDAKTVDWGKWAFRSAMAGIGAALLAGLASLAKLAWKHT